MSWSGRLLVVMAKAPRRGHVKTRLARCLDDEAVVALYRCLLEDTIDLARSLPDVRLAITCPRGDAEPLRAWLGAAFDVVEQPGMGLGDALDATFRLFASTGAERIVAFNSDSPHLPAHVLDEAFDALGRHDLVVGPTDDGGYYLVGSARSHPGLFETSTLGTDRALDTLVARAASRTLSIARTAPWYDIDIGADVDRLTGEGPGGSGAPRTRAFLEARRGR